MSQQTGYDLSVGAKVRRTYQVGALPLLVGYDRSDSLLDPTRGFSAGGAPEPRGVLRRRDAAVWEGHR